MNNKRHNRLITIVTPDVPNNFPMDKIPISKDTEMVSSDIICMAKEDHEFLKNIDKSERTTTFIIEDVPDDIPMDCVPVEYDGKCVVVEQRLHKPSDMPMMVGGKLINCEQPNMLPSIKEYDNDMVDIDDDPCNKCGSCHCSECSNCGNYQPIEFEEYDPEEEVYPQVVKRTDSMINNIDNPVFDKFNRVRDANNELADILAKRFGKIVESGIKDIISTVMEVQSMSTIACQADDRELISSIIEDDK